VGIRTFYPYVGGPGSPGERRRGPSSILVAVLGYGLLVAGAVVLLLLARA
jgi:hypothetical protein